MKTTTLLLALNSSAFAESPENFSPIDGVPATSEKSNYNLFNPTPNSLLRELSPDRPDATESPLTVDAGRFAVEMSLFDFRRDGGVESTTWGAINFKAGLNHNTDLQTIFNLYDGTEGGPDGFGDVTLHEFEFLHTAVLGFSLNEKTGAYAEYIGIWKEDSYEAYLAGGMNYSVNEHLILDFGVQSGLNSHAEDLGIFTGFTKRF
ncbi:hypothetical protein N9118_00685 [Akkermansiaceae bacterium]|nr:hypothetical protein [Akkermansiaceae bacterium]